MLSYAEYVIQRRETSVMVTVTGVMRFQTPIVWPTKLKLFSRCLHEDSEPELDSSPITYATALSFH